MARVIPDEITEKQKAWKRWAVRWKWSNTLMGIAATLTSTLIAANARSNFLSPATIIGCSMVAAGLAFLLTTLHAGLKAKGFALAARELEASIARYRFDDELPEKYLAQAEVRGIEILSMFDSKRSGS
jgi:hypothetical protein